MRRSLEAAKIGNADKIDGLRRLDQFMQAVGRSKGSERQFWRNRRANVRSLARWTARPWVHDAQGHSLRLDNYRFSSLCIRRNPHNAHPTSQQNIGAALLALSCEQYERTRSSKIWMTIR